MKRTYMIVLSVILLIVIVTGSTYAFYTWSSSQEIKGKMECFFIQYTKGQDIGSENASQTLYMGNDYREGLYASVTINVDPSCSITGKGTLYLNTDSSTTTALLQSGSLKYQVIENSLSLPAAGTISKVGQIPIYKDIEINTTPKQLRVSVWLDGSMVTEENYEEVLSSIYKGSITMEVESR